MQTIIDSITDLSLKVYNANDENILVLNSSESLKSMGISKNEYRSHMNQYNDLAAKGELPVPNFYFLEFKNFYGIETNSKCMLPDDFQIYVLDAKSGITYEPRKACEYLMPEKWKNGFTKGIAISLKYKMVLYWFATW